MNRPYFPHPKDVSPKDLLFYCHLKGKAVKMRFFANAQNDTVGSFLVILKPKAEGSNLLMFFKNIDSLPAVE
jgi:hypothetical protein